MDRQYVDFEEISHIEERNEWQRGNSAIKTTSHRTLNLSKYVTLTLNLTKLHDIIN